MTRFLVISQGRDRIVQHDLVYAPDREQALDLVAQVRGQAALVDAYNALDLAGFLEDLRHRVRVPETADQLNYQMGGDVG